MKFRSFVALELCALSACGDAAVGVMQPPSVFVNNWAELSSPRRFTSVHEKSPLDRCSNTMKIFRATLAILPVLAFLSIASNVVNAQPRNLDIVWKTGGYHQFGFTSAIAAPSPDFLITGGIDGVIQIWDTTGRSFPREIRAHHSEVTGLALLNDSTLVSCSRDSTIKAWDIASGRMLGEVRDTVGFRSVHVLADSQRVVCVTAFSLVVANVNAGNVIRRIAVGTAFFDADIAVSPVNGLLYSSRRKTIAWDVETGEERFEITPSRFVGYERIAVSRDGRTLFVVSEVDSLRLHDASSGALIRSIVTGSFAGDRPQVLVAADDGSTVLALDGSATVTYDIETGTASTFVSDGGHSRSMSSVGLVAGSDRYWFAGAVQDPWGGSIPMLEIVDIASGRTTRNILGFEWGVNRVVFTDTGTAIVATDGTDVRMLATSHGGSLNSIPKTRYGFYAVSIDGHALTSSGYNPEAGLSGYVRYGGLFHEPYASVLIADHLQSSGWGLPGPRGLHHWSGEGLWSRSADTFRNLTGGHASPFEFSFDGSMIVGRGDDGIDIWITESASLLRTIRTGASSRYPVFSRDGRSIATADGDHTIRIIDVASGFITRTIDAADSGTTDITALAFSQNAKWLLSASERGEISVWNVSSGELDSRYQYDTAIVSIDVSPDSKQIVTGGADGSVVLWTTHGAIATSREEGQVNRSRIATLTASINHAINAFIVNVPDDTEVNDATLTVHDVFGREVHRVEPGAIMPGSRLLITAETITSGLYLVTLHGSHVHATAMLRYNR